MWLWCVTRQIHTKIRGVTVLEHRDEMATFDFSEIVVRMKAEVAHETSNGELWFNHLVLPSQYS
jgi:hypothetical protein